MSENIKTDILRLSNEESNAFTKKCLRDAMGKMLAKKSLDKVRISELVKVAGVSRNAFYRNYESKEMLVEEMCEGLKTWMLKSTDEWNVSSDKEGCMISIFRHIKENSMSFRIMIDAHSELVEKLKRVAGPVRGSGAEKYLGIARAGAFTLIVREWITSGMQESPEEIGAVCNRIISQMDIPNGSDS